jgi:hypothetical protein
MKMLFSILMLVMLAGCANQPPQIQVHYNVWKLENTYDQPIADIMQWAADNFADGPNVKKDYWSLEMFELDINHDDIPEVFVTTPRLHGTGGGPYLVFRKHTQGHLYIGQLGGRQHNMRVLPLGPDGLPRIMTFWNNGGGSGTASVWKNDGTRFIQVSSEVIRSGDSGTEEGRKRIDELFGEKKSTSHCRLLRSSVEPEWTRWR